MIRSLPFLFFPLMLCCQNVLSLEESIGERRLSLSIAPDPAAPLQYHLYFEHLSDKKRSQGIVVRADESLLIEEKLFPGRYNLYVYGLAPKSNTTMQVVSFSFLPELELFKDRVLDIDCSTLTPSYSCEIDREKGELKVIVDADALMGLFRLSSLSLKQAGTRVKALNFSYDKRRKLYIASAPLESEGECLINLSYALKGPHARNLLKEKELSISTTYFKGLLLYRL